MIKYIAYTYKIGILAAAFSLLAFYISGYVTSDPTIFSWVFAFASTPLFVGGAIYFFRFKLNANILSFAEGMTVGFVVYFTNALLTFFGMLTGLMVWERLFQGIKENKIRITEEKKDFTISQYGVEAYQNTYESILNLTPFQVSANDFIWKIVFGLFFTIIISIILRKTS